MSESAENSNGFPSWDGVWQVPSLLLGLVLMTVGVYVSLPSADKNEFSEVLGEVVLYLKSRNIEEAQTVLQTRLEPFIGDATRAEQGMYYLTWGDLVYLQQEVNQWDKFENHQRVFRYYRKAEDLGLSLDETHLQRLAETLVAMKRDTEAMEVLDRLKNAAAHRRYSVVRRIIVRRRDAGAGVHELAPLMGRFENELREETDPKVRREQKMWLVVTRARGLLDIGEFEETIDFLQRQMISFMAEGHDDDLAPLRVLLAQSFHLLGELGEARRWYGLAQQMLESTDPLNADVLIGLAKIDLVDPGDVRSAFESFSVAESEYPTAPAYLDALIGRADCEARLGSHVEAREHFGRAVKLVADGVLKRQRGQVDRLVTPIHAHFELNVSRQDYSLALDYLSLLKPLYRSEMPPERLLEFAEMHNEIAKQHLAAHPDPGVKDVLAEPAGEGPVDGGGSRRLAMQEAAVHFSKAGEFYFEHAHAVTGIDDDGFGSSLWKSAISYDRAQLWDKAIEVYAEFIKARPGDPLQLEAIHRLGLAYQSSGQFSTAAELFKQLIEEHANTPEAYKALVPLARSHAALNEFEDAERVLLYAVTDHQAITPESLQYQEALIELGKIYYQVGEHEKAISRLTEAVDRYGRARVGASLRFRLADTYRLSIGAIDKTLGEVLPESQRSSLRGERARRLEQGQILFSQVISELETLSAGARTPIEKLYLRNAFFYRADCAYDLGRYEQAISLYDLAAKRWETHPASLVALVQIVNAYCELGRTQEAKVANDRARWQLKRIPDDVFDDPTLPMTREHWQDWLRWTSELNLFGPQANAAGAR